MSTVETEVAEVAETQPATPKVVVTGPGIYDMPNEAYHADPVPGGSISSTGARQMDCPAKFRWQQDHGRPPKDCFDLGHAAHRYVLGKGETIVEVPYDSWRTNAAKALRVEAREAGKVALLTEHHDLVLAMAEALLAHPVAAALFNPDNGRAEVSMFWEDARPADDAPRVIRRARLDWLPDVTPGARLIVPDYKTAASADPDKLQKVIADHGYHRQAAWNLDGINALGLAGELPPTFVLVFQEKTEPYVVTVVEPDRTSIQIGRYLNREAIETYRECKRTGHWPPYATDVLLMPLPAYIEQRYPLMEIA